MKKTGNDRIALVGVVIGLLGFFCNARGAVFVWDNDSGDNEWTNPLNWSPDSGVPGPADTVVFDNRKTGAVRVGADAQIRYLIFSNTTGTIELDIPSGYRLAPGFYWQTYNISADISVRMSGGGTFSPTGSCYIAFQNSAAGSARYQRSELIVSNITFDCSELNELAVSYNNWSVGALTARLDLSQASVVWKGESDILRTKGLLLVGGGNGSSLGELRLPKTLTNITVGTAAYLGANSGGTNLLHFGTNSALKTLQVGTLLSSRSIAYLWGEDGHVTTTFPKNIEVVIGSSNAPAAFYAGYYYGNFTPFIVTNFARFEGWLSALWVGRTANNLAGTTYAELDLSENAVSNLSGSISGGKLNIPDVFVGGQAGSAVGVLKLPSGITNFMCRSLSISPQNELSNISNSIVHLGIATNPLVLMVSNALALGYAEFQYLDGEGTTNRFRLPTGSRLQVGTSQAPTSSVRLSWFSALNRSGLFGGGLSDVAIYATNMIVGKGGWANNTHYGTNDFREATNFSVSVFGDFRIGEGLGCLTYLLCPPGAILCSNLFLGRDDHATYNYRAYLELSNTVVEVFDTAQIRETGVITNYVSGTSSGIALATTNLFVEDPNKGAGLHDYGRMHLVFVRDPGNVSEPYWGLRLRGNVTNFLNELTQTNADFPYVRLTWNTNGLSPKAAARFGIHYDAARDWSYVGVQPLIKGSLLIIR